MPGLLRGQQFAHAVGVRCEPECWIDVDVNANHLGRNFVVVAPLGIVGAPSQEKLHRLRRALRADQSSRDVERRGRSSVRPADIAALMGAPCRRSVTMVSRAREPVAQ